MPKDYGCQRLKRRRSLNNRTEIRADRFGLFMPLVAGIVSFDVPKVRRRKADDPLLEDTYHSYKK